MSLLESDEGRHDLCANHRGVDSDDFKNTPAREQLQNGVSTESSKNSEKKSDSSCEAI